MGTRTTIRLTDVLCLGCLGHVQGESSNANALQILASSRGRCPECGKDRFRATIEKKIVSVEDLTAGQVAVMGVGGLLGGAIGGALAGAAVDRSGGPAKTLTTYDLRDIAGLDLVTHLSGPPEDAVLWITAFVKELAKANLRPDQGICTNCDEIYTRGVAGPTAEGYCSMLCQRKAKKASLESAPQPKAAADGKVSLACPHCHRKFRGSSAKAEHACQWCGKRFTI